MITVEKISEDIRKQYTQFQSLAISLSNLEEPRTELEKYFFTRYKSNIEQGVEETTIKRGAPFIGNIVPVEFKETKPELLLVIYAPCYDKSEHNSSEALLRGAFLKSALYAEKEQKEVLAISLENLNFPESVLEGIILDITETVKDISSNWQYLKKLVFIDKG